MCNTRIKMLKLNASLMILVMYLRGWLMCKLLHSQGATEQFNTKYRASNSDQTHYCDNEYKYAYYTALAEMFIVILY